MITLTLVHPLTNLPAQSWTFEQKPVIKIGRSPDNDVILYSAVVSRYHLEIQQIGCKWKIINLGTNGTYLADQRIREVSVENGTVVRLARSGPKLQIQMNTNFQKKNLDTDSVETVLVG